MATNTVEGRQFVVIKSWHAVLTLIAWLVLTATQFVTARAQTEETARRVHNLESNKVEQKQFDELRDDITNPSWRKKNVRSLSPTS